MDAVYKRVPFSQRPRSEQLDIGNGSYLTLAITINLKLPAKFKIVYSYVPKTIYIFQWLIVKANV